MAQAPSWRSETDRSALTASGPIAGPLSRAGEGQGEGCDLSGLTGPLTPTRSRTGEGARRAAATAVTSTTPRRSAAPRRAGR
ncbi:MAG: hypothetical protein EKK44_11870 [Methylobacterium sp.]|nr:MAG: hypothetical protein EKK44_11870 [Methylobacterium sp.]